MTREKLSENELDLITGGKLYVQSNTNGKKYLVTAVGENTTTGEIVLQYNNGKEVGYAETGVVKNSSLGAIIEKAKWEFCRLGDTFNHTVTVDEDLI